MMSLLTRTKSYFVVICVLMVAFLGTFSWRLLYNSYDSSLQPKPPSSLPMVRRFSQDKPRRQDSYVVRLSSDEVDVKVQGPNKTNTFTQDEISKLLSKIHELGLSASEVQERLSSWQRQSQRNISWSSPPSHNVVMPSREHLKIKEKPSDSFQTQIPIRKYQHTLNEHQTVLPSEKFRDSKDISPDRFRNPKDILPDGFIDPKVYSSEKTRVSRLPVNSLRGNNIPDTNQESVKKDFHARTNSKHNSLTNEIEPGHDRDSGRIRAHGSPRSVQNGGLSDETSRREPMSRTEQSRKQREKYLQFLKEKFELSKTNNTKIETKKLSSDRSGFLMHKELTPDQRSEHNLEHDARTQSPQNETHQHSRNSNTMFDALSSKYPPYNKHLSEEDQDLENEGTQRPDYCRGCFDFNFKTIIDHPKLCKSSSEDGGSESVFLLMLISSAPGNYHARTVIRQTWGAECRKPNSTLRCLFVIGLSKSLDENSRIQLENDHHDDILQLGFKDSYSNLTYKTITSFKWATQNCYSAKYIMKTDDDMYVNTHLIPIMLEAAPRRKFMGGSCWGSSSPNRDVSSKWFVSLKSFHKPKFPPMCSGTGYIMSIDVLRSVLFASRNVPFFHLEDVYVALCLQKYGVLPVNIMGFSNMFQEFGACFYRNSVMTSHQVPPELLEDFWLSMNKCPKANISPAQLYIIMPFPETD